MERKYKKTSLLQLMSPVDTYTYNTEQELNYHEITSDLEREIKNNNRVMFKIPRQIVDKTKSTTALYNVLVNRLYLYNCNVYNHSFDININMYQWLLINYYPKSNTITIDKR